jgi:hypothetical protein
MLALVMGQFNVSRRVSAELLATYPRCARDVRSNCGPTGPIAGELGYTHTLSSLVLSTFGFDRKVSHAVSPAQRVLNTN